MQRVLVAPAAFKGVASAPAVAAAWAAVVGRRKDVVVDECPVADGGDDTLAVVRATVGGLLQRRRVSGPLGRPVDAVWLLLPGGTAFVESAEACGMRRLARGESGGMAATSAGVGELLAAAVGAGAARVTVGIGGTASSDGGRGAVEAFGRPAWPPGVDLTLACDVRNPLLGPTGAVRVFGPQKGIAPDEIEAAEARLAAWADSRPGGRRLAAEPGAGAGGGLAFGLLAAFGAIMRPGFDIVAGLTGLSERVDAADTILTGEGRYDAQSAMGKATGCLIEMARVAGKRVVVVAGSAAAAAPPGVEVVSLAGPAGGVSAAIAAGLPLIARAVADLDL